MDLTIDVMDYKLNIRAAAAIIHNNKILVHKNVNKEHYCLVGGRVEIGENSKETIKREVKEELGREIEVKNHISTIENFFEMNGQKYHEILFLYSAEFIDDVDKLIDIDLKNIEGKEYLIYTWLDLDNIRDYEILPKSVSGMLQRGTFLPHEINDELKK